MFIFSIVSFYSLNNISLWDQFFNLLIFVFYAVGSIKLSDSYLRLEIGMIVLCFPAQSLSCVTIPLGTLCGTGRMGSINCRLCFRARAGS